METNTFNNYFCYIFLFVITMIFSFTAKQLQEMAKEFEEAQASGTFEAPWWMSDETAFPNSETEKKETNEKDSSEKSSEDTKPAAKPSPQDSPKSRGCPRRRGNCRGYYGRCDPNAMFQHCLRMQEAARRQREAKKTNIVEQKSPIHMNEETDDAAKMSLDLTGFSASNISIHVENHIVSIVANRTNKLGDVFVVDRRFRLDKKTADPDQITSTFEDGILELTVPKKSVIGPRKIPVVVATPVSTNEESIERDSETSKTPNCSPSPYVAADEEVKFAESTVEDTPSPTPAKKAEPEEQVEAQEEISVETVDEQEETVEEEDNNANSGETVSTKESEDWEEVSNWLVSQWSSRWSDSSSLSLFLNWYQNADYITRS